MERNKVILLSLIPVYMLVYTFLFGFLFEKIYRMALGKKSYETKNTVDTRIGLVVYLCGQIGCGKTTLGSAICNDLALILIEKAKDTIQDIMLALPELDFKKIDSIIEDCYQKKLSNPDKILVILLEKSRPQTKYQVEGYYYDYLFPETKISKLKDYIKAKIALIRDNYVYFTRRNFYSWTNDRWAMNYDSSMLEIKTRHQNKDYKIADYCVIFEDEKILSGTDSLHSSLVAKEDGGKSTYFRIIRHIGKNNVRYITSCQDFSRDVKEERELATDIIYIEERKEIPVFSFKAVFDNLAFDFINNLISLKSGIRSIINLSKIKGLEKEILLLESRSLDTSKEKEIIQDIKDSEGLNLKERKKLSKLNQRIKKNFSDSYIRYKTNHYNSATDYDKKVEPLKLDFCFPLAFAYGSCDTYAFSFIGDTLSLESIEKQDWYNSLDDSIPVTSIEKQAESVEKILKKRVSERKSKSNTKCDKSLNYSPF